MVNHHKINYQDQSFADFTGTYVGLDMSLTSTGLAAFRDNVLTTHLLQPNDLKGMERLRWYRHEVGTFLRLMNPDVVCLENYAFNKGNQAHQIGELGGMIRMMLWEDFALLTTSYLVAPATMKKFVTGSGAGAKTGIPLHLFKRWGLTVDQGDEADATGLALMALYSSLSTLDRTKAQAEAMDKATESAFSSTKRIRQRRRKK